MSLHHDARREELGRGQAKLRGRLDVHQLVSIVGISLISCSIIWIMHGYARMLVHSHGWYWKIHKITNIPGSVIDSCVGRQAEWCRATSAVTRKMRQLMACWLFLTAWDISQSRSAINNPGWSWPFHHGTSCSFSKYERLQRQDGELGRETRKTRLCLSVSA